MRFSHWGLNSLVAVGLIVLVVCAAPSARAGSLSVAPTRVELDANKATGAIKLSNTGTGTTLVQVEAFAWKHSSTVEGLSHTDDLLAVPAVFDLGPGDSQIIRVAARSTPKGELEQSYRLLITEVPRPGQVQEGGVIFAMRFNVPVFLTPIGAVARPEWSIETASQSFGLNITNKGTAHLRIGRLQVKSEDGNLHDVTGPIYVQPGQTNLIPLPIILRGESLTLEADTNIGEITVDLAA